MSCKKCINLTDNEINIGCTKGCFSARSRKNILNVKDCPSFESSDILIGKIKMLEQFIAWDEIILKKKYEYLNDLTSKISSMEEK